MVKTYGQRNILRRFIICVKYYAYIIRARARVRAHNTYLIYCGALTAPSWQAIQNYQPLFPEKDGHAKKMYKVRMFGLETRGNNYDKRLND